MTKEFDGKVVLITGAGSGIGRTTALAFAREGARLCLTDINEGSCDETRRLVDGLGAEALAVGCDVSQEGQVRRMVEATLAAFGALDVAFNNAGIEHGPTPLVEQTEETYDRIMDVNLRGVWLCMKYELPPMLKQGAGAIINTSAISDMIGAPAMQFYAASKHAVLGLTRAVALENIALGVRINAVAPAGILTPMLREHARQYPGIIERAEAAHPIGRLGSPEEIADAVLFLASERSSFIVGQSIKVDGGYTVP